MTRRQVAGRTGGEPSWHVWVIRTATVVVCGAIPALSLYYVFSDGHLSADFGWVYYPAAEALLAGESIYPSEVTARGDLILDYLYPPLTAMAAMPFTLVPVGIADAFFSVLLVAVFGLALAVLGVRDWRCYGLAFVWPPVLDAIQTANVTVFVCLAAALVWRYRDRAIPSGAALGLSLATKVLLWPLAIWLAASKRFVALGWMLVAGVSTLGLTWGAIGFDGLSRYPDLLRSASALQDEKSYTLYALALDLGAAPGVARVLWGALAIALLAATVVVGRRGDDRRAFVLAVVAAIACSPVVWLHYLALLLVLVAITEPRLSPVWFLGLPMHLVAVTRLHNGSTFQTAAVMGTAALIVVWVLRRERGTRRRRSFIEIPAATPP